MSLIFNNSKSNLDQIIGISKELPDWFTETALKNIEKDFNLMNSVKAVENGVVVAFAIFELKKDELEIHWLAVKKSQQRKGLGAKLIKELESLAKRKKIHDLVTITLDERTVYKPYESTRAFYLAQGFVKEKVDSNYWGNKNVALFMRKKLTKKSTN